jgi:hypothetical protein
MPTWRQCHVLWAKFVDASRYDIKDDNLMSYVSAIDEYFTKEAVNHYKITQITDYFK